MELKIKVIGNLREDLSDFFKKSAETLTEPTEISIVLTNDLKNVVGEKRFILVEGNKAKFIENGRTLLNLDVGTEVGKEILWVFVILRSLGRRFDESFIERRFARKLVSGLLQSLVVMMEVEDEEGKSHSQRVTDLAMELGKELGYDENELEILREGAMLHDVGKIGIEQLMLYTPTRLRILEDMPQDHTIVGTIFLGSLRLMDDLIPMVRSHHERWDGTGYPDGLKGEEIPEMARVIAICDWFDNAVNFVSSEFSGEIFSVDEALNYIDKERGRSFDPRIASVFTFMMRKRMNDGVSRE